jgi:hypothetical protein
MQKNKGGGLDIPRPDGSYTLLFHRISPLGRNIGDMNKGVLGASNSDIRQIILLNLHPILSSILARLELSHAKNKAAVEFKTLALMNRTEGNDIGKIVIIVVAEHVRDKLAKAVEIMLAKALATLNKNQHGFILIFEVGKLSALGLVHLPVEMILKTQGESSKIVHLPLISKSDKVLANVLAFDAATDTLTNKSESKANKRCIVAADNTVRFAEIQALSGLNEILMTHVADIASAIAFKGNNVGNILLSSGDDIMSAAVADTKGKLNSFKHILDKIHAVILSPGESIDSLSRITNSQQATIITEQLIHHKLTNDIGILSFIHNDPIILVEVMIEQQGKIDHIVEVDVLNIAVIKNQNLLADFDKIKDINIHVNINVLMTDDINPSFGVINSGATINPEARILSKRDKLHNGATALHKWTALGEKLHDIINLASENLGTRLVLEENLHTLAVESSSSGMRATHSGKAALKLDHDLLIECQHKNAASHSGNTLNSGGGFTRTSLGINNGVAIAVLDPVENVDLIVARGHNDWSQR